MVSGRLTAVSMRLAVSWESHAAVKWPGLETTGRDRKQSFSQCEVSPMSFTLYNAPPSTCSQRVRFVLNAKGLPFTERKLDLLAGDQLKPDYLALNPNGVVPTLVHDGAVVIDSSVIIEYLDEVMPQDENFTPKDPAERAAMRALMRFIDEMPAAAVRVPTFNLAFLPRFAAISEEEFVAFAESK